MEVLRWKYNFRNHSGSNRTYTIYSIKANRHFGTFWDTLLYTNEFPENSSAEATEPVILLCMQMTYCIIVMSNFLVDNDNDLKLDDQKIFLTTTRTRSQQGPALAINSTPIYL